MFVTETDDFVDARRNARDRAPIPTLPRAPKRSRSSTRASGLTTRSMALASKSTQELANTTVTGKMVSVTAKV